MSNQLSREKLLEAYRLMRTIREFEERLHVEFATGEIPGFVHLYAGEEAAGTGIMMHLGDGDRIASTHRGHGHCIAKGVDVIAAKIREVAGEHAVPIFEAPPLARVLYRNVDIGDEIPSTLYVAVAQILTYVFQLKVAKRAGHQAPPKPDVTVEE